MHAFFVFSSVFLNWSAMVPGVPSGDRGNWGYESWRLLLYANESRDASMWFIFGDDWNDACKLITFLAVWQWCNFPRFSRPLIFVYLCMRISIGNSMICSDIWHKYDEWYFEIFIRTVRGVKFEKFWNITSGIYAKYHIHVQIMLLFAYTTTHKRFVIFTCRYFKLSWNTNALSQSNCSNFSCSSIKKEIPWWENIIAGKSCFVVYWGVKVLRILSQLHFFFFYCRRTTSMPCFLIHHSSHAINRCWHTVDCAPIIWNEVPIARTMTIKAEFIKYLHANFAILLKMTELEVDNSESASKCLLRGRLAEESPRASFGQLGKKSNFVSWLKL